MSVSEERASPIQVEVALDLGDFEEQIRLALEQLPQSLHEEFLGSLQSFVLGSRLELITSEGRSAARAGEHFTIRFGLSGLAEFCTSTVRALHGDTSEGSY